MGPRPRSAGGESAVLSPARGRRWESRCPVVRRPAAGESGVRRTRPRPLYPPERFPRLRPRAHCRRRPSLLRRRRYPRRFFLDGRGHGLLVHRQLDSVDDRAHDLVEALVVEVAQVVVAAPNTQVDEVHLVVEDDEHRFFDDHGLAADPDVASLGDGEHVLARLELDGVIVDEDRDIRKILEGGVDRLEHHLPRDSVCEGKGGQEPAAFLVMPFQVHACVPLASGGACGAQPFGSVAGGTCIMISMESMNWHIDLLNFS